MSKTKLTIRDVLREAVEVQADIDGLNGQIEKLTSEVTSSKGSVAEHLMLTAAIFKTDHEAFNNAVKADMEWLKSDEAGKDKVDKIPRCFIQAKSDIIGAMKLGINPSNTKSYHDMKEKKVEGRKQTDKDSVDSVTFDTDSGIGDAISTLIQALKDVPVNKEAQVIALLESSTLDLMVLLEVANQVEEQPQQSVVNH